MGDEEVAPQPPVVADLHRDLRRDLLLHADADTANRDCACPNPRGQPGLTVVVWLKEPQLRADHGPHSPLAAGFMKSHSAHAISIGIRPRSIDRCDQRRACIADRVGITGPGALEVLPHVQLQRGFAVAEHVVGRTDPGRDVVVALHTLGAWQQERTVNSLSVRIPFSPGWRPARGGLVAQGGLDRQPFTRPLVLNETWCCRGGCCWSRSYPRAATAGSATPLLKR